MVIDHELIVSWLATICTIGLFLTGVQICWKIASKKSTSEVSFIPFLAMFCNASLWFKYGLIKKDLVIIGVNSVGSALSFIYMLLYYFFTSSKLQIMKTVFLVIIVLFPLLTYIQYYTSDKDTAIFHLGLICASSSVFAYGAPLTELREVFRTKSTACLAFPLCLANFIVSSEWLVYGIIKKDSFVKVPNGVGFLLSSFQLFLFMLYPSTSKSASKPGPASPVQTV